MSELAATADNAEADTPVEMMLLRCPEVFCYKVPPQASAAGHRAEDWNLGEPRFTGRLHLVGVGSTLACRVDKQDGRRRAASSPDDRSLVGHRAWVLDARWLRPRRGRVRSHDGGLGPTRLDGEDEGVHRRSVE